MTAASRISQVQRRGAVVSLVFVSLVWPPPAGSVAPATPPCRIAPAFSPAFDRDGTAICLGSDQANGFGPIRLYVTVNGGRSWDKRVMEGLNFPPGTGFGRAWVSPNYPVDHTLYLGVSTGLYASTDGRSFSLVSNRVGEGGSPNFGLTPYLEPEGFPAPVPGMPAGPHAAFAYASLRDDDLTSSRLAYLPVPVPVPVLGSPGDDERFLVPRQPGSGPFAFALARVANDPASNEDDTYQLFGCTRELTCQTPLFGFPLRFPMYLHDWVFAADYPASRTFYLHFVDAGSQRREIWRSTDGGQTFERLAAVAKLIAALPATGDNAWVAMTADPARPNRLYLLLSYHVSPWRAGLAPSVQMFRSDDDGTRWSRVAWGLGLGQPGPRGGTLPILRGNHLGAPRADKLFAGGITAAEDTLLYCSVDAGVTWRTLCTR